MKTGALRWLYRVSGCQKGAVAALTLLQMLNGGSGVLYALLLRGGVDAAVGGDRTGFWQAMGWLALLTAGQLALRAALRWMNEYSRSSLENRLKTRLTHTLLQRDVLQISAVHSGEWLNRLTNDAAVTAGGCVEILPGLAGMAVKLISALVMLLVLQPWFAAVVLPGGALLAGFGWLFRRILKRLHKQVQESDGRLRVFLQERLAGLMMIRSFGAEAQTERDADGYMRQHRAARMRKTRFSNLFNTGLGVLAQGMTLFGVGWCCLGLLAGSVTPGTLVAVSQLMTQIQAPFANISGYLPRFYALLASAERLMEVEAFAAEVPAALPPEDMRELYGKLAAVGLRQVDFAYYPPDEGLKEPDKTAMPLVLHGLSLEIAKGETVAFTGRSGCGKSTALKLLMCVCTPDGGERYALDRQGRTLPLTAAHRRLFAYVPQGNALMRGTVRQVVSFAAPEAAGDDQRLARALHLACADEFVAGLEQGVDTLLGERGAGLSEGQMQRLAIARALFADSPILLLDEATSALDVETEKRLLGHLREMTDKTVVIVTHRPAVAALCDRVVAFTGEGRTDDAG